MTTTLTAPAQPRPVAAHETARIAELLRDRFTIRIISELADFGPIPTRQTSAALPDIPAASAQSVLRSLRRRQLIACRYEAGRRVYETTAAGDALGDVYDSLARWARGHDFPTANAAFIRRVDAALALLADTELVTQLTSGYGEYRAQSAVATPPAALLKAQLADRAGREGYQLTGTGVSLRRALAELHAWIHSHAALLPAPR
ncbi:winged helix-turn-helix transcriptional regulator [Streptomyces sp. NPDC050085]|uniref:winged helix-turn-helix transcriptional regulator n=1 Tax=Streptomyces sp. NPDC050085 TaxID=3365600 RepID=UPI0037A3E5BA